ncbi:MAG: N-acetylmuramoyl-L-alanine amidase [bacterium]|nr:N-acetylmuramoyl-L-alanine amidase [bacterium]
MRRFVTYILLAFWAGPLFAWTICLDPGHGGSDPGATGSYYTEKEANLDVALKAKEFMIQVPNVTSVEMTRTSDVDVSLEARVNYANSNSFDRFISIHQNAYDGTVQGTETYCYIYGSSNSFNLRDSTHVELVRAYGYNDRGAKTADYYVLRNTTMPAILGEGSFIDYAGSYNESWRYKYNWYAHVERQAYAYTKGLCKHLGLSYPSFVCHTNYPDSVDANTNFTVRDSIYIPAFQAPADVIFEIKSYSSGTVLYQQRVSNLTSGYWIKTFGSDSTISLPDSGYDYYVYFVTYVVPAGGNWDNRYAYVSTRLLPTKVKSVPTDTSYIDTSHVVYKSYPTEVYADSNFTVQDSFYIAPTQAPADLIFEIKHRGTGNVLYSERVSNISSGYWIKTFGLDPTISLPDSGYDYQVYFLSVLAPPGGGWSNRYAYASTYSTPTTVRTNLSDTSYVVFVSYPDTLIGDSLFTVVCSLYVASSQSPADFILEVKNRNTGEVLASNRQTGVSSGYTVFQINDTVPDQGVDEQIYFNGILTPPDGGWSNRYTDTSTYSNPSILLANSYVLYLFYPDTIYFGNGYAVMESLYVASFQAPVDLTIEVKEHSTGNTLKLSRYSNLNQGYYRIEFSDTFNYETFTDSMAHFLSAIVPPGGGWSQRYTSASTYQTPTAVIRQTTSGENGPLAALDLKIYNQGKKLIVKADRNLKNVTLVVHDVMGRVVKRVYLDGRREAEISLNVEKGVYFYRLTQGDKIVRKGKFVVFD